MVEDGHNPYYKYDVIYYVLIYNLNVIHIQVGIDQCSD